MILGNIQFDIEIVLNTPSGQIYLMKSAKCLETNTVYSKEQANRFYMLYSH